VVDPIASLVHSSAGQRKLLFVGDSFTFGSGTMPGRKPLGNDPVYNCRDIPDYYPSASNYWSWGAILCREIKVWAVVTGSQDAVCCFASCSLLFHAT
jgi:hypothetical protein